MLQPAQPLIAFSLVTSREEATIDMCLRVCLVVAQVPNDALMDAKLVNVSRGGAFKVSARHSYVRVTWCSPGKGAEGSSRTLWVPCHLDANMFFS